MKSGTPWLASRRDIFLDCSKVASRYVPKPFPRRAGTGSLVGQFREFLIVLWSSQGRRSPPFLTIATVLRTTWVLAVFIKERVYGGNNL